MRMPADDMLEVAIEWLRSNEGDGLEGDACKTVAAWLQHREQERMIRATAREVGVPTDALRQKLARISTLRSDP